MENKSNIGKESNLHTEQAHTGSSLPTALASQAPPSSFLSMSRQSYALCSAMNQMTDHPEMDISYDELLNQHAKAMEELNQLPLTDDGYRSDGDDNESPSSELPTFLWSIRLRQYLLVLHLPFAQKADMDARFSYSRIVCLTTANTILDQYSKPTLSRNYSINLLREDVFRSTLAVCRSIMCWNIVEGKDPPFSHCTIQV
jgi:hypothetical protein